jgi:hypothetical protein
MKTLDPAVAALLPRCVECQVTAPFSTRATFGGTPSGWTLGRVRGADGFYDDRLFCPECWKKKKEAKAP